MVHRLVDHSTLGSRVIKKKKREGGGSDLDHRLNRQHNCQLNILISKSKQLVDDFVDDVTPQN